MVINVDIQKRKSLFFGAAIFLLLIVGLSGNYYFAELPVLLRAVVSLAIVGGAGFLFSKTILGKQLMLYWQEALVEVRKVVWPTKKETIQSTIGVLAMVLIMGIFLWSIDAVLVRIVAWLLKTGGA